MTAQRALVSVIDDDASLRESLPDLLGELGFSAHAFSSAEEFLASEDLSQSQCLILDVAMHGMSGPELHSELRVRRPDVPVIFITARRDENLRAQMLARGAIAYLFKPFSDTALLEALEAAFPD